MADSQVSSSQIRRRLVVFYFWWQFEFKVALLFNTIIQVVTSVAQWPHDSGCKKWYLLIRYIFCVIELGTTKLAMTEAQSVYVKTCMHPFSSTNAIFHLDIIQFDGKDIVCVSAWRIIMCKMRKWFDVPFAMLKSSKTIYNLDLCLILTCLMSGLSRWYMHVFLFIRKRFMRNLELGILK